MYFVFPWWDRKSRFENLKTRACAYNIILRTDCRLRATVMRIQNLTLFCAYDVVIHEIVFVQSIHHCNYNHLTNEILISRNPPYPYNKVSELSYYNQLMAVQCTSVR